jgi:hypothetical protein
MSPFVHLPTHASFLAFQAGREFAMRLHWMSEARRAKRQADAPIAAVAVSFARAAHHSYLNSIAHMRKGA